MQFNKRLMNGALLCFSSNNFETFFFGTVAGFRNPEQLQKGILQIKIETENMADRKISPKNVFVMIESKIFFEVHMYLCSNLIRGDFEVFIHEM